MWVIPPEQSADFVHNMEQVLDVYQRVYDAEHPVICLDESPRQLLAETRTPIVTSKGETLYDYEYERKGVVQMYMLFEPLAGKRYVEIRDSHNSKEWAKIIAYIAEQLYPTAQHITIVQDNLSAHKPAALYEVFEPERANQIRKRISFVHTPKHGSWLNMAEIEFSVLTRQGIQKRVASKEALIRQVKSWQEKRNSLKAPVDWQFTNEKARVKLKRLYPNISS